MIAADIDKFYRKVLKDFIANLGKSEYLLLQLEQSNIYLNQIEQKMLQKLQHPSALFHRLIRGQSQIQKQMLSRYASLDDAPFTSTQPVISQSEKNYRQPDSGQLSFSNDLEMLHNSNSHQLSSKNMPVKQKYHNQSQSGQQQELSSFKRRAPSEFSMDDLSGSDEDQKMTFRLQREKSKIHILGTYDLHSKKHDFKQDKTQINLENVIVKVEGMSKEIFLKTLQCRSRKLIHHE